MDPLVRSALWLQRWVARALGTAISGALGAVLIWSARSEIGGLYKALFLLGLGLFAVYRLAQRLSRPPSEEDVVQLDLEVFSLLAVFAYGVVLRSPAGLDGPAYAIVYALAMLAASYARPWAAALGVVFAVLLEAALTAWGSSGSGSGLERWLWHSVLMVGFSLLNHLVFRAEIERVRKLSRVKVDSELRKMRESARTYRLLGAPTGAVDHSITPPPDDPERLLRSGVDEIHQAVKFALWLLRKSLGLRTAMLLGLDSSGSQLNLQEIETSEDNVLPGPFGARDGIFGAALEKLQQVSVSGPKASHHIGHYATRVAVGAASATPVLERGQTRGLLVVDREAREPFSHEEEETLQHAARFIGRAIENERVFVQLERAKVEQGKLYRAANALASATTEAQVIEAGVSGAREFAAFDFAVVTLFDKTANEHEICAVSGDGASELVGQRFRHNSGLVSMVVENRHALPYRGDYDSARQVVFTRRLNPPKMPSLLVLPLCVHDRALGTLVLGSKRARAFGDSVRPTLEVLASHVAVSLANARMLTRLEELATLDGLTGLYNKRALTELAGQKLRSATRFNKPLSLLVCDIDFFKKVNDTYGHDVGDLVIRGFGDVLRRVKRDTDAVGRFGGEEFVLVCEETDERGAAQLAERIRSELEATTFHADSSPIHVTCSIGVAPFPAAGRTWETLFKATDEALYASKRGGRNRVTIWNPKLQGCAA
ncbi:MAG TPA: diguanylate cyclase [Polyangiaceae bacterium]|nr:diguanylate cyclase [Polyangiaceae bacterium]